MDDRSFGTLIDARQRARLIVGALSAACVCWATCFARDAKAAELIGGSLAITSNYVVRGISRSSQDPAIQGDFHVVSDTGLQAGLFASSVQFDPTERRDVELSGFAGYARRVGNLWQTRILASYYSYPWNASGSRYNYGELAVEASYADWLDINLNYSPDSPRYLFDRGLTGVSQKSAEATAHSAWWRHLAASAGAGYSELGGSGGGGYLYWSLGAAWDLAPWTVSLIFVDTHGQAGSLYDGAAVRGRFAGTLIWRF